MPFVVFMVTLWVTVTSQLALYPPSTVVAVMTALPLLTPVTTPELFTVAMEVSELDHVTDLFVALLGSTVAVRVSVEPDLTVVSLLFSVTCAA